VAEVNSVRPFTRFVTIGPARRIAIGPQFRREG
jgi:hypothetical protein